MNRFKGLVSAIILSLICIGFATANLVELDTIRSASSGGTATRLDCPINLAISGNNAYTFGDCDNSFSVFDISTPTNITETSTFLDTDNGFTAVSVPQDLFINGSRAYLGHADGFTVYNISNPASVTEIGVVNNGDESMSLRGLVNVFATGSMAYAVTGSTGDQSLVSFNINGALAFTENGTLSDVSVGGSANNLFRPSKVVIVGNNGFVLTDPGASGGGITVVDVANPASMSQTAFNSFPNIIDMEISGNRAYVVYAPITTADYHLAVVDISNPASMGIIGSRSVQNFGIPTTIMTDISYENNNVFFASSVGDVIGVVDVTTPASMTLTASAIDNSQGGGTATNIDSPARVLPVGTNLFTVATNDDALSSFSFNGTGATPPLVTSLIPVNNGSNFGTTANLVINFDEPVQKGTGNIVIQFNPVGNSNGNTGVIETIPVTSSQVTIVSNQVTIDPTNGLAANAAIQVSVASTAFEDTQGTDFAGLAFTDWEFTTANGGDTSAPTVTLLSPANGSSNVNLSSNLVMTFNEDVFPNQGNVLIRRDSDDTTLETIDIASAQVTFNGNVITINPTNTFSSESQIYIQVEATAIRDGSNNLYAGISDKSWRFSSGAFDDGSSNGQPLTITVASSQTFSASAGGQRLTFSVARSGDTSTRAKCNVRFNGSVKLKKRRFRFRRNTTTRSLRVRVSKRKLNRILSLENGSTLMTIEARCNRGTLTDTAQTTILVNP